jgi:phospholipase/carboxylesterase
MLESVIVETGKNPTASVIWLHGLGADGHDFEPLVPQLVQPQDRPLRFVFPHAPVRPVTLNGGYAMRAWYDIIGIDRRSAQDEAGIRQTDQDIAQLIHHENERGIKTERIVLAGFSQGGAMTLFCGPRYPQKLAGLLALSCYLPLAEQLAAEQSSANLRTDIFMAHGEYDNVVDMSLGQDSRLKLESCGFTVQWRDYPMAHSLCTPQIEDIANWLRQVLPS